MQESPCRRRGRCALSPLLAPAARLYAGCMALRARCYALPWARPYTASCPVVSIGNIAWGGSGKTPLARWLLGWAEKNAVRAVVLTRGYKASPPALPHVVSPSGSARESGDEPLLLARSQPDALVLVDPQRARAAAWAEKNATPHMFILDDGMQHMALRRDLDIVLLRPRDLLDDWNAVIPSGPWREGAGALARAGAFCVKSDAASFSALAALVERRLAPFGKPVFSFRLAPTGVRRLSSSGAASSLRPDLGGKDYVLADGVGNPEQVAATAKALLGVAPKQHCAFPDHHAYTERDAARLSSHGLPVVCTAKDAVKLAELLPAFGAVPVWVLETCLEFGPALYAEHSFPQWWEQWWQKRTTQTRP